MGGHESQNGAAATASATAAEFAYPLGHCEHLNSSESTALNALKKLLETKKIYKAGPPPSHDDATLIRFLRARRWVPEDALVQFEATEEWRKANDIDVLYETIDLDAYEQSRIMYPQWTGRRDRRGIPLYVFQIRSLDNKSVANYEKSGATNTFSKAKTDNKTAPGLLRLFALYENLCQFTFPLCTQLQDRQFPNMPITMSTNIVDISGVSLRQFWNLKSHMQAASVLATANYPETLDRIFIIGAPSFFSTVWGWVKRWFDPTTVSKIFILSPHEVLSTLAIFIDPKHIPKQYGGRLEFHWGNLPTVDPAWNNILKWENGHKSFPTGPLIWRSYADASRIECVGLGTKNGKPRSERICTVPKVYKQPWERSAAEVSANKLTSHQGAAAKEEEGSEATLVDETARKAAELSLADENKVETAVNQGAVVASSA